MDTVFTQLGMATTVEQSAGAPVTGVAQAAQSLELATSPSTTALFVAGPKGDMGDTGPKGDTGDTGPKGDTGDQGPPGEMVWSSTNW
jgi:hypothetical protein